MNRNVAPNDHLAKFGSRDPIGIFVVDRAVGMQLDSHDLYLNYLAVSLL